MNKVVFSVSKAGRSQSKLSGVGYIDGQSFLSYLQKCFNNFLCLSVSDKQEVV